MTTGQIHLTGYVEIPADRLAAVLQALPEHIALTRAEPGCLSFEIVHSADDPTRLLVAELFTDQAAFDAHQHRAGASAWARITAGLPRHYTITTTP
ncbi:putative quinol monooxygenase [Devosia sp. A449]